jgi:hypothetical protein
MSKIRKPTILAKFGQICLTRVIMTMATNLSSVCFREIMKLCAYIVDYIVVPKNVE